MSEPNPATGPAAPSGPAHAPWSPTSWRAFRADQQPQYPDSAVAESVIATIAKLPPLVTSGEVETLKTELAEAARGERFLLQGGDCAENFDECDSPHITSVLKILLQMSLVLVHGTRKRVIRVGRFAGQYAKPRSSLSETKEGVTLPCYRGDIVNRIGFSAGDRVSDPMLLLRGYERSALTLNFIRALVDGGFADLHHPDYWDLEFVRHSPLAADYHRIVESIGESLRFMETLAGTEIGQINRVDFYTSHEGLILLYEQAQTRQVPRRSGWYNLSTHFPWIGVRTATRGSAHVEFFRGIANPIGIKIGPDTTIEHLLWLIETLDPAREAGRLTLIHRFGAHQIAKHLPELLRAVQGTGRTVLWSCDPMHGNTETVVPGEGPWAGKQVKTRKFMHILAELEQAFEIHRTAGTILGGVHLELTGENVTECIGGARGLSEVDLSKSYRSQVDPRLNYEQALEMAMLISRRMGGRAVPPSK
ncbi:MAG: 3-deoxy-7-phosphoheptulonate synthase class II [Phycisphaerae bacterium]|nr:3-deoxy-7-phosphoheptulonate synthase class II [Phycisphaerae bacterium]